jgi:hypothetical protein
MFLSFRSMDTSPKKQLETTLVVSGDGALGGDGVLHGRVQS